MIFGRKKYIEADYVGLYVDISCGRFTQCRGSISDEYILVVLSHGVMQIINEDVILRVVDKL